MFAFGGLETAFCWVFVGALFWKRANKTGAIASMVGGTLTYCLCMAVGFKLFGLHQIVIGITVALSGQAERQENARGVLPREVTRIRVCAQ